MTETPNLQSQPASNSLSDTAVIARDLIKIDTTNWGGGKSNGELEAAEYVSDILRTLELTPTIYESERNRTSVVARVKGNDSSLPALVLHGHLDVVPADPSEWSVPPFEGRIKDGMLWGRGAVDMKNMDAMILTALTEIIASDKRPKRDIVVAFFADEEAGGVLGSHYLVENHPELFKGAKTAVSEVGGYSVHFGHSRAYLIQTGEKAMDWIKIRARGVAEHGSRVPTDNALTKLARAVVALGTYQWPIRLCETTSGLLSKISEITGESPDSSPEKLMSQAGAGSGFMVSSIRTTTNPTVLQAGYKHNVIPESAEALIDVRSLPQDQPEILAKIQQIVGSDIEIEIVHSDVGLEVPFSGEIVEQMKMSLKKFDPDAHILPYLLSGGTDNKALSKLGIKGYGFVPLQLPPDLDFPAMFHGVDERVPLSALDFGHQVLVDFLFKYRQLNYRKSINS